jgi:hypothetical protein
MFAITVHSFEGSTFEAVDARAGWFADTEPEAQKVAAQVESLLEQQGVSMDDTMIMVRELDDPTDRAKMLYTISTSF